MATENPVFQVLVPSGNQSPLAAGSMMSALAVGQIGIFNIHTGLSIDGTVAADAKDIYFAVGVNRTGAGGGATLEDVNGSSGQMIQVARAKSFTVKATVDEVEKVIEIAGFSALPSTEYTIKIEFRNGKVYAVNGYNQFAKAFSYFTNCSTAPITDCDACPAGDCNELALGLMTEVNADQDALILASMFYNKIVATVNTAPTADANVVFTIGGYSYTAAVLDADTATQAATKMIAAVNSDVNSPYFASAGAGAAMNFFPKKTISANTATIAITNSASGITINAIALSSNNIADAATLTSFEAANPGVCVGLRLTGLPETRPASNGDINIRYTKTGTDFLVSLVAGFDCNGSQNTTVNLQYKEGNGYDLQQLEYVAGGWNGKPGVYRQNAVTGLQKTGFEYFISKTANYNVISICYDINSVGGWLSHVANNEVIIAVPCADTTTLQNFITMTDRIFTQFGAMTNDVAGMDCSNGRIGLLTPATDGIESLA